MAPKEAAAANQNAVTIGSQPKATAVPVNRHLCPPAFPSSTDFGRAPENTVPLPRRPSATPLCRCPAPPAPAPRARRNLPGASGARPGPGGGTHGPCPGHRGHLPTEGRRPGSAVGQPRPRSPLRAPLIVMQTLSLPAAESHPSPLEAGSRAGANRIFMRRGKSSATLPKDRGSLLSAFSQA